MRRMKWTKLVSWMVVCGVGLTTTVGAASAQERTAVVGITMEGAPPSEGAIASMESHLSGAQSDVEVMQQLAPLPAADEARITERKARLVVGEDLYYEAELERAQQELSVALDAVDVTMLASSGELAAAYQHASMILERAAHDNGLTERISFLQKDARNLTAREI